MDVLESKELVRTFKKFISIYDKNHQFTATDLCNMHKEWLGSAYSWAGRYRQVNLTKGDFTFTAAHLVPGIFFCGTGRSQSELRTDGEDFRRSDRVDFTAARAAFPVEPFFVERKAPKADREIPSIADDVATLITILASRSAGSFK